MSLPEADTALFIFINSGLRNAFFDWVMPVVTTRTFLVFLPFLLVLAGRHRMKFLPAAAAGLLAIAMADAASHVLKDLFMRPRPCAVLENVHLLVGCGRSFSLPSSHAANSFAVAAALWFLLKDRLAALLVLPAVLISFSRIAVGVHYPADVLAGALVGSTAGWVAAAVARKIRRIAEEQAYADGLMLFLLLLSFFRITFILTGPFDLTPDEAHYWEWSRRLDWSYYSKGPMIAWLVRAGTAVFGNTVLGLRVVAVVLSALSSMLLFRLGRELYGERTGLAAAILLQIIPLFSVFGILLTIDSPFTFFWVLSLYLFHRAVRPDGQARLATWALTGLAVGLGLLTKYTMAFFPLSAFLFLCFRREARPILKTPGPYLALLTSAIVFSPVLIWNASHNWVTVRHTAGQAHLQDGLMLSLGTFAEFFGSQLGVVTPLLFALMIAALLKVRTTREGSFLFWLSLPILVFFLLKSIQGKVQANWAMTGYISACIAFAAVYMEPWGTLRKPLRFTVGAALILALALSVAAHFPAALKLPDRLDPTLRLVGWKELGREADAAYRQLRTAGPAFIFSTKYQISSELAFYMENNPVTYCADIGRRMNQYDLWPGFESLVGQNALFVVAGRRRNPKNLPKPSATAADRWSR